MNQQTEKHSVISVVLYAIIAGLSTYLGAHVGLYFLGNLL